MSEHILPTSRLLDFITAGNAIFTVINDVTGNRYTFKTSVCTDRVTGKRNDDLYFVGVLTGPDNTSSYQYLGTIRRDANALRFDHGRKSAISFDAPSARAFRWTFAHIIAGEFPDCVRVMHAGRCGRCGRVLTVPESIESGYGPECIGKVGGF